MLDDVDGLLESCLDAKFDGARFEGLPCILWRARFVSPWSERIEDYSAEKGPHVEMESTRAAMAWPSSDLVDLITANIIVNPFQPVSGPSPWASHALPMCAFVHTVSRI